MNNYQLHQENTNNIKLLMWLTRLGCLSFLIIGLTCLIITPIKFNSFSDRSSKINQISFIIGTINFSIAIGLSFPLRRLEGKVKVITEIENEHFIENLLSFSEQVTPVTNCNYNSDNLDVPMVTSVTLPVTTETVTSVTDVNINEIVDALHNNKSDSFIIKEIMGYGGRRYAEGKDILETIKSQTKV